MSDNGLCLKHDAEIENIKKEILRLERTTQRDISEIKEENKIQNKEFREIFSHFADMKEALVTTSMTMKALHDQMIDQKKDNEETRKEIREEVKEIREEMKEINTKVEAKQTSKFWSKFENSFMEYIIKGMLTLIGFGAGYLILNIDKFMK